eukprot:Tamp_05038.p1 GENE.Tamp_05038~~Tamp_05038.p1  ORF type:complete len:513 (-),score=89.25 Tamp_05038:1430-2968(-)
MTEALLCLHESALLTQRDQEAGSWTGAHAGTKKHSPQDKRGGRDKEPKTDEVKKSKGRSLELNETLATIAHLYASKERNPDGLRNEKINKKDFWRIFGEVILMRQQLEGNRSKNFTKFELREMTDDMFDVLDTTRKGYLLVEDLVRFFYSSASGERVIRMSNIIRKEAGLEMKMEQQAQKEPPSISHARAMQLKDIYEMYDEEGTGRVTEEMFKKGLDKLWEKKPLADEKAGYWKEVDTHGKGYVTQEEFIDWLQDTTYVVFEDLNKGLTHEFAKYVGTPRMEQRDAVDLRPPSRNAAAGRSRRAGTPGAGAGIRSSTSGASAGGAGAAANEPTSSSTTVSSATHARKPSRSSDAPNRGNIKRRGSATDVAAGQVSFGDPNLKTVSEGNGLNASKAATAKQIGRVANRRDSLGRGADGNAVAVSEPATGGEDGREAQDKKGTIPDPRKEMPGRDELKSMGIIPMTTTARPKSSARLQMNSSLSGRDSRPGSRMGARGADGHKQAPGPRPMTR